jgi:hypothetical protein
MFHGFNFGQEGPVIMPKKGVSDRLFTSGTKKVIARKKAAWAAGRERPVFS